MKCCNAKGMFTGLLSKEVEPKKVSLKEKNKNNEALQSVPETLVRFNIKRQKLTVEELLCAGDNTTYKVLGDPVYELEGSKDYLLCECKVCGFKRHVGIQYLRNKKVICDNCFRERLKDEASSAGLTLIGEAKDKKRRYYKFNDCGHTREIATGDVRVGDFSCTECMHNKMLDACKEHDAEFLQRVNGQRILVKFNKCGHEADVLRISVFNTSRKCPVCAEVKVTEAAKQNGLTILKYISDTRRLYKVDSCGHEKIITLSNMKSGSYRCEHCLLNKLKLEAEASGLEYISNHAGNHHKYKAPCGCTITKKLCAVRVGHWTCNKCEKGFRDFPNNLYLFKFVHKDFEWLKFGYSKNPKHRKNDYKLIEGVEHELLVTHELPTGALAVEIENRIHGKYKEHNIPKDVMKQYMTESGFTETYPIELLPQFLDEFTKLKELNE